MDAVTQGSCLCGAVTYQISTPLKAVTHCHCKKCQKGHGAAFATYASAPLSAFSFEATPGMLKSYESSPGITRQFCSACGSSLFWNNARGHYKEWISIALGTLDTAFIAQKQTHTCMESKGPGWAQSRHEPNA